MGSDPYASVDNGGYRHGQLNRRNLKGLSKRHGGQFHLTDIFFLMHDGGRLPRQINARFPHQAKILKIAVKPIHPQPQPHIDKNRITGVFCAFHKSFRPVSGPFVAMNPSVFHYPVSGAGESIVDGNHLRLQSCRRRDDFKGASGLIRIVDAQVSPHLISHILNLFCRPALCFRPFRQCERIVERKLRYVRHGVDFSVLRIHQQNGHLIRLLFFHYFLGLLLHVPLYIIIHADMQIIAGHRFHPALSDFPHFHAAGVRGGENPAVDPLQYGIILHFQPDNPLIIASCKSQHPGSQIIKGVIPLKILIHFHPIQIIFPDPVPRLLGHIGFDPLDGTYLFHPLTGLLGR